MKKKTDRKRILITNDDGYFSDGIQTLFRELRKKHDVFMVAPDREQSASSHSLTLNRPLRMQKIADDTYTTDGTPTDCVMLAIHKLYKRAKPEMIISGINHGSNMGDDVTYSGTVAAAIEGSILQIPSMAVSLANWEPGVKMTNAAKFVTRLVAVSEQLLSDSATFLNVNLPNLKGQAYRRFEFTQLGVRQYKDIIIHKVDPRGKSYYWIGGQPEWKATEGSDFEAVKRGVVSITPLKLNFTDQSSLERLRSDGIKLPR